PSLGAHLVTPRFAFAHHGIYIGGGRVVHYSSLAHPWRRKPVEEVSLGSFAQHHEVWIRAHAAPRFAPKKVIGRARSRLGEDEYRLLSNNCEHFCEWCVQGEHRSYQVDALVALARRLFTTVLLPPLSPQRVTWSRHEGAGSLFGRRVVRGGQGLAPVVAQHESEPRNRWSDRRGASKPGQDEVRTRRPNRRASSENAPGPSSASDSDDVPWMAAVTTSAGIKTPGLEGSTTVASWTAAAMVPARGVAKPASSKAETVLRASRRGTPVSPLSRVGPQRLPATAIRRSTRANPGTPPANIVK